MPTTVGDYVQIAQDSVMAYGTYILEMRVTVDASGFSGAKHYIIPITYDSTANVYHKVQPVLESLYGATNDFQVEINMSAGAWILRIVKTAGTTAATARIDFLVRNTTADGAVGFDDTSRGIGELSGTGSVTPATIVYAGSLQKQIYGSMYLSTGNTAIAIVTIDVWVPFASGWSELVSNGMTFQNAKELKILTAGNYLINWTAAGAPELGTDGLKMSIAVNGTEDTKYQCVNRASVYPYVWSGTGIRALAVNDLVSLTLVNNSGTGDVYYDSANVSILKVG
jgi:hypothetical protein